MRPLASGSTRRNRGHPWLRGIQGGSDRLEEVFELGFRSGTGIVKEEAVIKLTLSHHPDWRALHLLACDC